jgi:DNA-binding CsgD family transcriptional regulator
VVHLRQALERTTEARIRARIACQIARVVLAGVRDPGITGLLTDALAAVRAECGPRLSRADQELSAQLTAMRAAVCVSRPAGDGEHRAATKVRADTPELSASRPAGSYRRAVHAVELAFDGGDEPGATRYAQEVLFAELTDEMWPTLTAARVLVLGREFDAGLDGVGRLIERYHARSEIWCESVTCAARALMFYDLGDVAEARRDADLALHLAARESRARMDGPATVACSSVPLAKAYLSRAVVLLAQAQVARAQTTLENLDIRWFENDIWDCPRFLLARATAAFWQGDMDGSLRWLRACGRTLAEAGVRNPVLAPWWMDAVATLRMLGRHREAAALAEEYDEYCRRWNTPRSRCMALLARAAAASAGKRLQLLTAGAETVCHVPPMYQVRLLVLLGSELYEHGDRVGSRRYLHDAMTRATRHGFTALAVHARGLLRTVGGRTRSSRPSGTLTDSERTVVELAASGATNREIAERLFIAVRTVEFHLTNVYRRFGLRNRADLARIVSPSRRTGGWKGATGQDW